MSAIWSSVISNRIYFIASVQRWYIQDAFLLWGVVDVSVDGANGCDAVDPATIAFANDFSIFFIGVIFI